MTEETEEPRNGHPDNGSDATAAAGDEPPSTAALGPQVERRPDGLELARIIARATAGATPAKKAGRRRPGRSGSSAGSGAGSGRGTRGPSDDRDPQPLDSVVSRLVGDHGWELSLRVHSAMARWPEIVGDDIAAHAQAESFADGRLTVRTDSTAWATQLKLLVPTLLTRLNDELGHGTVTVLEVLGPQAPSWARGARRVRGGRGPRDTYG